MERQYKDSGIAWADQIPVDWRVIKGKNLLNLMSRPVRQTDDVVTCFRDGEVVLRSERRTEGFTMSDKEIGYQGINKGDIVIHGMDGFAGAMGVSKSTGKGSPVLIVCTPKDNDDSRYIIYYLRAMAMNNVFLALATGIRERSCDLRWNKISDLPFIRPNADEQKRIANYIDKKCGEIDELIEVQEQMIQKLTDYKQSVITEAVTKGLNPNVRLVPSGIDWIGDIPEGWKVSIVTTFFYEHSRKNEGLVEQNLLSLSYGRVVRKNINTTEGLLPLSFEGYNIIDINDIVFRFTDLQNDHKSLRTGLCKERGIITSAYTTIRRRNNDIYANYFQYLFHSYDVNKIFYGIGSGVRQSIKFEDIKNLKILIPPLSEQISIASFIDAKCIEIDSLIALKQQKIEKLKEYKKSVIYEAVTGKIVIA